ncbi:hypothetical protein B1R94_08220 [Mycolicibacterium litorale]|nr:hypothetical protein B1R94_08220 [Mycolicibacterium litorale]
MGRGLATALGVSVLLVSTATAVPAAADPDPLVADPADPAAPATVGPPPGIGSALAQSGAPAAGPLGLPDLSSYAAGLLLAQNAVPSAPGGPAAVTAANLNAFDSQYLLPQNVAPAAPGEGVADVGLGPTTEDPSAGRLAFLRRVHEMYQAGALRGALLGQVDDHQLGQPLPGTAPGPDIHLPPGLGPAIADPAAAPTP